MPPDDTVPREYGAPSSVTAPARADFKLKARLVVRKEAFHADSGLRGITAFVGALIPVCPLPHTGDFSGEVEKPHFPADRPRCRPGSQRSLHH